MKFENIKILLTGGSGFVGTNLLEKLVNEGYEVLNIDIEKPKDKNHLKYWQNIDITNLILLKESIDNFAPNYIVHLAARTDLDGKSLQDYNSNILGVENLMNVANELETLKKIIITSSMLVCYGGYYPKDQFDYAPSTVYGESKVKTEEIVWKNKPLCDWAIIRPFFYLGAMVWYTVQKFF